MSPSPDPAASPTLAALHRARETQDRIWRWMQLVGPLLTITASFVVLRTDPMPRPEGRGLTVAGSFAAFAIGAFGVLYRRRATGAPTAGYALLLVAGAVALVWAQSDRTGFIALFVAMFLLARHLATRLAFALSAVAMAFLVLAGATTQRQSPFFALLTALVIAGFAAVTMATQRLREANELAAEHLAEYERTRAAETRAAALAERQHLAREMHDVLAHSLAGLMLQLEGARLLAAQHAQHGGDPRLPEAIERAHRFGKSGLDEARRAIEMLRDEELPGPERIAELAARCSRDLGIPCRLTVDGEPPDGLDSRARLTVYRVAQEALTNVAKHADPDRVELALTYTPEGAVLTVEDVADRARRSPADPLEDDGDGATGAKNEPAEPGYGLTGMRERAELLGGALEAAPTGTGFLVRLRVPA